LDNVKFAKIKAQVVKIGEAGLIEVSKNTATSERGVNEFLRLDRSYQDAGGNVHQKGSITIPSGTAAAVIEAMKAMI